MTYITLTKAVCVMFLRERSMRGQCMRTWSSSGSQSGIAERVLRPPGGEEVTCFRRGTSVDEGLRSLKDCVGRRPEYAATKENKPQWQGVFITHILTIYAIYLLNEKMYIWIKKEILFLFSGLVIFFFKVFKVLKQSHNDEHLMSGQIETGVERYWAPVRLRLAIVSYPVPTESTGYRYLPRRHIWSRVY